MPMPKILLSHLKWRAEMHKQEICPDILRDLYLNQGMSAKEASVFLQEKPWIVSQRLKELGIRRSIKEALLIKPSRPSKALTNHELEALDGFLLGDGSISKCSSKSARLSLTVKHEEFGRYLLSFFDRYNPKGRQRFVNSKRYKTVLSQWSGETKSDGCFLEQRNRWYPQGSKIVPKDVILTPLSVMLWYLGDGCLVLQNVPHIFLHTQGFSPEDVDFLCLKMNKLGIQCHRDKQNKIYVGQHSVDPFFRLVGTCPVLCYLYKFNGMDG